MFDHPCFFYDCNPADQCEIVFAIRHGGRGADDGAWQEMLATLPGIPGEIHDAPDDTWAAFSSAQDEPGRVDVAVWDEWAVVYQNQGDPLDPSDETIDLFVSALRAAAARSGWLEIISAFGTDFEHEASSWTRASLAIRLPSRIPARLMVGQSPLASQRIFGSMDLVETIEGANAEFLSRAGFELAYTRSILVREAQA